MCWGSAAVGRLGSCCEVKLVQVVGEVMATRGWQRRARIARDAGSEVVAGAKSGDPACVEVLVNPRNIRRLVSRSGGRRLVFQHEMDDFTQDVTERALRRLPSFKGSTVKQFEAWIRGIARNAFFELARRNVHQRERLEPLGPDDTFGEIGSDPSDLVVTKQDLLWALQQLSPDERLTLLLKVKVGLSSKEVAERIGYSAGTVDRRVWTARKNLARLLEER